MELWAQRFNSERFGGFGFRSLGTKILTTACILKKLRDSLGAVDFWLFWVLVKAFKAAIIRKPYYLL